MALVRKILLLHFCVREFQIESNNRVLKKKEKKKRVYLKVLHPLVTCSGFLTFCKGVV